MSAPAPGGARGGRPLWTGLGLAWAAAAVPLVLATFIGLNGWARVLVQITGVAISPWYTGGKVVRVIDHGAYRTHLHEPVFTGLLGPRKTGFVQVDLLTPEPAAATAAGGARGAARAAAVPDSVHLPGHLVESVDFDGDGAADFRLDVDTRVGTARVTAFNPRVLGVHEIIRFEHGLGLRVRLRNRS
ncbi:MAG TPA: hypothetical protein VMS93_09110 [Candidatus Saccharimonadales bacterium]|nr:hypothetical protein [Candidatus Saccharimonadales bacterium]